MLHPTMSYLACGSPVGIALAEEPWEDWARRPEEKGGLRHALLPKRIKGALRDVIKMSALEARRLLLVAVASPMALPPKA